MGALARESDMKATIENEAADQQTPEEWLRAWLRDCHAAMEQAPPGPTALEHLEADRNRLEPG
ncbi:MAG: hypothetical protein F4043_02090 [Gammaproteobacteria bacterium]|nr:hypothetical protein [Gammaproteobacteria bacterium]